MKNNMWYNIHEIAQKCLIKKRLHDEWWYFVCDVIYAFSGFDKNIMYNTQHKRMGIQVDKLLHVEKVYHKMKNTRWIDNFQLFHVDLTLFICPSLSPFFFSQQQQQQFNIYKAHLIF